MTTFPAYATNFELYPQAGTAFDHLSPLIARIGRVEFSLTVVDPTVNSGQIISDFDDRLEEAIIAAAASPCALQLPEGTPQELDFAFSLQDRIVTVEIEKANREKILRDILKCHIYLHAGADFAVVVLPRNYAHAKGVWNLFDFGVQRYDECLRYRFGIEDVFGRIVLLGFDQFDIGTGEVISRLTREHMRAEAIANQEMP